MLEAGGVLVHVGGAGHASVEVNSAALAGHRLCVPALQHLAASELLLDVLAQEEWAFSHGLQRAVRRFVGAWAAMWTGFAGLCVMLGAPAYLIVLAPLNALVTPVNPQGRGDYYLHPKARHPAA